MTLEQQVQEDIKQAMKAKDTVAMNATRAIKGQILLFKTSEGGSKEVTDGDILNMIRKLVKQRKEAAEQYTAAGRQELADNEMAEAAVLEKYLPKQLSVEEVKAKVQEIIALRQFRLDDADKPFIIRPGHPHIHIIVPGNKALVPDGTQHRPSDQEVPEIMPVADL